MWAANSELKRAYKVVERFKTNGRVRLRNEFGTEWDITEEKLLDFGYKLVKNKPAWYCKVNA